MHEMSLMKNLIAKAVEVVDREGGTRATRIGIRLGALSHMSPQHLKEHFDQAAAGTPLEHAELEVEVMDDIADPEAQSIVLTSVDIADD